MNIDNPKLKPIIAAMTGLPIRYQAYILATADHETGGKFEPVEENLRYTSAARIIAVWPSRFPNAESAHPYVLNPIVLANEVYAGRNGNTSVGDGWDYRGRGLVQITGRGNYRKAGQKIGIDLEESPKRALELDIAIQLLVRGMVEGWYTGKKLDDSMTYTEMRRVVNGTDQAVKIAMMADEYEQQLRRTIPQDNAPQLEEKGWFEKLITGLISLFR